MTASRFSHDRIYRYCVFYAVLVYLYRILRGLKHLERTVGLWNQLRCHHDASLQALDWLDGGIIYVNHFPSY